MGVRESVLPAGHKVTSGPRTFRRTKAELLFSGPARSPVGALYASHVARNDNLGFVKWRVVFDVRNV